MRSPCLASDMENWGMCTYMPAACGGAAAGGMQAEGEKRLGYRRSSPSPMAAGDGGDAGSPVHHWPYHWGTEDQTVPEQLLIKARATSFRKLYESLQNEQASRLLVQLGPPQVSVV